MIDVTIANFETEVIEASSSVPVLVDFWAPWCGPCKTLGPLLEKLEAAYSGRFKLVKIDSDQEQQLASAFGIRSIPTCVLMVNGQPVDGFTGALPEGQLKAFLDKHLPEAAPQAPAEPAPHLDETADPAAALAHLADMLAQDPANDDLRFDFVKRLIGSGQLGEAAAALAPALGQIPLQLRFEALSQWLNALEFATHDPRGQWPVEAFDQHIEANKRDFDSRFAKSRVLIARGDWQAALEELLEIIMRDKKWADEAPRKTYIALLELLTPPKPREGATVPGKSAGGIELAGKAAVQEDPQAEMVSRYRRKLSMALN